MNVLSRNVVYLKIYGAVLVGIVSLTRAAVAEPTANEQSVDFAHEIQPVFATRCYKCHGPAEHEGGLRLDSRQGALAELESGEFGIVPGEVDSSEILHRVSSTDEDLRMPPEGKPLSEKEIAAIRRWIEQGAQWDQHWAFTKPTRPAIPEVNNDGWVTNSIDAFVLNKLEADNLKPARPASKTSLLRRAYYDLIGLPPTPEEVAAFLADKSDDAYEKIIDRLLDSPRYGEKWARHWLDLVRYAETNSYERDSPKPNVWRYRDYVIRSFNDDKPYDQFLTEQLAGDELDEITPDSMVATGYYRLGIWDDEPVSNEQAWYDEMDDVLMTTSQVMLGLTINCARCHDHKLDPLPQRDYYQMLAFFSGLNPYGVRTHDSVQKFSVRSIATEAQQAEAARQQAEHDRVLEQEEKRIAVIEKLFYDDLTPPEKEDFKHEQHKVPLAKKRVPALLPQDTFEEYVKLRKRQRASVWFKPPALREALAVTESGGEPPEMYVLGRGNSQAKGVEVQPAFPSILSPSKPEISDVADDAKTCRRRLALARWIAGNDNPLTARVWANRIWQHHFGRGIVRSSNDFGLAGMRPSHPALLDWLASELVDGGWKNKPMHKLIMLSNTYRMSSEPSVVAAEVDPTNDRFWRFDMRRLTAEEIRDSVHAVCGNLNLKMYGHSIYPGIAREVLAGQSRPGSGWHKSSPADQARRSIYIHLKRSLIVPFIAAFDGADPDATCPVRFATTQPTQALGTLNGKFMNDQAVVFAKDLRAKVDGDVSMRVRIALWRVFQREPTDEEIERGVRFIQSMTDNHGLNSEKALEKYCLLALNLNEFIYLD